ELAWPSPQSRLCLPQAEAHRLRDSIRRAGWYLDQFGFHRAQVHVRIGLDELAAHLAPPVGDREPDLRATTLNVDDSPPPMITARARPAQRRSDRGVRSHARAQSLPCSTLFHVVRRPPGGMRT